MLYVLSIVALRMIESLIQQYGLHAIFLLMFANGLISGPPSELTLAFGGVWASAGNGGIWQAILAGMLGNLAGTYILYLIGYHFGYRWISLLRQRARHSTSATARLCGLLLPSDTILEFAAHQIRTHGLVLFAAFRCLPCVRSVISLPAGMYKIRHIPFLGFSSLGILCWATGWTFSGYVLAETWRDYHVILSLPLFGVLILVMILLKMRLTRDYRKWERSNCGVENKNNIQRINIDSAEPKSDRMDGQSRPCDDN